MNAKRRSGKKKRLILKILIGFFVLLLIAAGTLFAIGYFYYGKILRTYFTEFVQRESKGVYTAEMGAVYIDIVGGNLAIRNLSLVPDTAAYHRLMATDTLPPVLFKVHLKSFRIRDFNLLEAIRERRIHINEILVNKPEITLMRMQPPVKKTNAEPKKERTLSIPLPKNMVSIEIQKIRFRDGKFDYFDYTGDSVVHIAIPSGNILVDHILVDSAHTGKRRIFNADDISVVIKDFSIKTKNQLNKVSFGEIGLSTAKQSVYVKDFHLIPQYDRKTYSVKFGSQTDRLDVLIPLLRISRLDLRGLLMEGRIQAGLVEIEGLKVDDYRDKRIPRKPGFRPPMPQDGIRKMRGHLQIDTVIVKNGRADYAEQVGAQPGTIYVDKINGMLTGLTNDSAMLAEGLVSRLKGTAYLMGKGKLDLDLRFHFGDPGNHFTFSATLGQMDLREINPMLTKLLPAEITSGKVSQVVIPNVTANDDVAQGTLVFYYKDLAMKVTDKQNTTWSSIKTGLINFVANDIVIPQDNPMKSGKLKSGIIYFERDKEKGIINFVWKSALSGLKSQMGFNSQDQKSIKKESRIQKKEEKKKERKEKQEKRQQEKKKKK